MFVISKRTDEASGIAYIHHSNPAQESTQNRFFHNYSI